MINNQLKLKRMSLCVFLLAISLASNYAQTISLRMMSMNIREGGEMAQFDSEVFCAAIRTYNPDFVAIQELDNFTKRNGYKDFLNEMAVKLGMFPFFGKAMTYDSGDFGIGILSRYPFFNARTIVVQPTGANEPRACSWIDIALPNKRRVRLAATHLDVANNEQIRVSMLAKVNTDMLTNNSYPTLLMGDFNALPESETMNYAKLKWQDIGAGTGNTIPVTNPTKRIDYVMGYPKSWVKKTYQIVSYPNLSDHCFIVADVEFP